MFSKIWENLGKISKTEYPVIKSAWNNCLLSFINQYMDPLFSKDGK